MKIEVKVWDVCEWNYHLITGEWDSVESMLKDFEKGFEVIDFNIIEF